MNRCSPDAYVPGPDRRPPDDPTDYDWEARVPKAGCNRLVCPRCKADVTVVSEEPQRRVYACRCFEHSASSGGMTLDLHWNPLGDPEPQRNLPWACGGHPSAELPIRFGDRTIVERAELASAIVAAAEDRTQVGFVVSLLHRTKNGSLEGIVLEAAAQELSRSSRERRARLVDLLATTVWESQPTAIAQKTIDLLCKQALKGVITSAQLRRLENRAGEWLAAHVKELLTKNPDHVGPILAWGGRAMFAVSRTTPEYEAASKKLAALARGTGLDTETVVARVEEAFGTELFDNGPTIQAIGARSPRRSP